MAERLIITNGDDSVGRCRKAGIGDDHLAWVDVLYDGPVQAGLTLADLSQQRAQWIAGQRYAASRFALRHFQDRDNRLANCDKDQQIILLFEHDPHDQLQLLQLLDWFASRPELAGQIHLAQARQYLAALTDVQLQRLCDAAPLVRPEQFADAQNGWRAFRARTPEHLVERISGALTLPFAGPALRRMLEELPAVGSGLGRSELQVLMALGDKELTPADIYARICDAEEAVFMPDWSLYAIIDRLATWPNRLLRGHPGIHFNPNMALQDWRRYNVSKIGLSRLGAEVLSGRTDAATLNRIDRWVGGTHLVAGKLWRWDAEGGALKPPG